MPEALSRAQSMNATPTFRLYVNLSASQARKRLKGHGFGVRRVESVTNGKAVILHTATGDHRQALELLFSDVQEHTDDQAT